MWSPVSYHAPEAEAEAVQFHTWEQRPRLSAITRALRSRGPLPSKQAFLGRGSPRHGHGTWVNSDADIQNWGDLVLWGAKSTVAVFP